MLISSQLFDRIVGTAATAGGNIDRKAAVLPVGCRRKTERRTATRIAFGQRTLISRDRGTRAGAWETVMMQDISLNGIGFLCHDPMEKRDTFVMKVIDKDDQVIRIRCSIQRCERGGFGGAGFLLGAEFLQVIQHQAVRVNEDEHITLGWQNENPSFNGAAAQIAEATGLRKAAVSFLKSLDPSHWLRKSDDYSSVG